MLPTILGIGFLHVPMPVNERCFEENLKSVRRKITFHRIIRTEHWKMGKKNSLLPDDQHIVGSGWIVPWRSVRFEPDTEITYANNCYAAFS
jgi:hypothetical protein